MGSYQVLVCQSRGLATVHGVDAGLAFAALCLEMHAGSKSAQASCARARNIQAGKGTLLKVMDCERKHCWYRLCPCALVPLLQEDRSEGVDIDYQAANCLNQPCWGVQLVPRFIYNLVRS